MSFPRLGRVLLAIGLAGAVGASAPGYQAGARVGGKVQASPEPATVPEGTTVTITVRLDEPIILAVAVPVALTVNLTSSDPSRVALSVPRLEWAAADWWQPRTFEVTAVGNGTHDALNSFTISGLTASGAEYYKGYLMTLNVITVDDDPAPTTTTAAPTTTTTNAPSTTAAVTTAPTPRAPTTTARPPATTRAPATTRPTSGGTGASPGLGTTPGPEATTSSTDTTATPASASASASANTTALLITTTTPLASTGTGASPTLDGPTTTSGPPVLAARTSDDEADASDDGGSSAAPWLYGLAGLTVLGGLALGFRRQLRTLIETMWLRS